MALGARATTAFWIGVCSVVAAGVTLVVLYVPSGTTSSVSSTAASNSVETVLTYNTTGYLFFSSGLVPVHINTTSTFVNASSDQIQLLFTALPDTVYTDAVSTCASSFAFSLTVGYTVIPEPIQLTIDTSALNITSQPTLRWTNDTVWRNGTFGCSSPSSEFNTTSMTLTVFVCQQGTFAIFPSMSSCATAAPTAAPTTAPTAAPTTAPTTAPTAAPTAAPTTAPTPAPTPYCGAGVSTPRVNWQFTASVLSSGNVLVIGGKADNGTATVPHNNQLWSSSANTWTVQSAVPGMDARFSHAAITLPNSKILVVGGSTPSAALTDSWLYNPVNDTWTQSGNITETLKLEVHMMQSTHVLLMGKESEATQLYTIATGLWAAGPARPANQWNAATCTMSDGQIVITGGSDVTVSASVATVSTLVSTGGPWISLTSMNAARLHHGIACLTDGSIVVVGGTTDLTNPLSSAERYSGGAWVHLLSIGEARMFPTVMPLSDARAIYIGGTTDAAGLITSAVSNDVSIYSVANNTWTAQTSLITSRRQFKAVQITGAIMVINGITGNGDIGQVNSTEFVCAS